MFKVLGADQKEYGPVSSDTLRQWIAEGRAAAQTMVKPEGQADWQPLSSLPEFAAALAAGRQPPVPADGAMRAAPEKTSGLAIASLVLGILGPCSVGLTALVGLVLGIVALVKIDKSHGRIGGKGLAIAGVVVSGVFLLLSPGLFLPALVKVKPKAQTINCVNNLKQLGLAVRLYAADNNDTLPNESAWGDALQTYVGSPRVFQCPAQGDQVRSSYAYNAKLSGRKLDEVNPQSVLFFECQGGWNLSGGAAEMVTRHHQMYAVGLVDGSAQQVSEARLATLRWDP